MFPWGVLYHTNYTAGYAIFLHKSLHSKITETACVSILAGLRNKLHFRLCGRLTARENYTIGSSILYHRVLIF